MILNKTIFSALLCTSISYSAEVSVFGAGNLNSDNPYGLNNTEKYILNNKKELRDLDTKLKSYSSSIEELSERIDGIESIYEGDSQKLNSMVVKFNDFIKKTEENTNQGEKDRLDVENIKKVVEQLLVFQEESSVNNKKNFDSIKKVMNDLSNLVNEINSNYISAKELKKNMDQFITVKEFEAFKDALTKILPNKVSTTSSSSKTTTSTKSSTSKSSGSSFDSMKKREVLSEAKRYFKKDYFTKAIPMFEYLIKQNYRPAESNFYLGEIWYYRKKYERAIAYFKKSAILYDKASYMPKLMYHSAIAFEKIGQKENADNFYSTLVDLYPKSSEAKEAKKKLNK